MIINEEQVVEGLLAFRGCTYNQLQKSKFVLKENYGKEAYWFKYPTVELLAYGKEVEWIINLPNFSDFFELKFDYEFYLNPIEYKPTINGDFQYRILTEEDEKLVKNFEGDQAIEDLEMGQVDIEDFLVVGAFAGDKLVAVSSLWEWTNNVVDIGLIVDKTYRGKGLGKSITSFIINQVIDKRICIYRADYENPNSIKIAKSLGFRQVSWCYRLSKDKIKEVM